MSQRASTSEHPAPAVISIPPGARCESCGAPLAGRPRYSRFQVCDECGHHDRLGARRRIETLVDQGSYQEIDPHLASRDPLDFADADVSYADRLRELAERTGETDAIVTGTAAIRGHRIVVGVLDFGFLGGSMGVVVGEKLARAADRALRDRLPLVTVVASGGARMQEGLFSLLQMAKTAAAIQRLHRAGIPYVSVLTHPTTGGVFASFSNLGDVVIAEPGALIGFAGPRVAEQMLGRPLPPGTHTAEFLLEHGLIDRVLPRNRLRGFIGSVLDVLAASPPPRERLPRDRWQDAQTGATAWSRVEAARDPDRPTMLDYVERMLEQFVEIHGDRLGGDDPAVIAGLGFLRGRRVAVVGFERGHDLDRERRRGGRPLPDGYRKAQRLLTMAARFGLPVLTLVDTPGAYPGIESEERGLALAIAETMALMSEIPVPIVSAIIGEGGSGGALALACGDRVLIQEQAIYSVIAPEGAAAILYRDPSRAAEVAERLRVTAADVAAAGIADQVVPEPEGGAKANPAAAAKLLEAQILVAFDELANERGDRLLERRTRRYRSIGSDQVRESKVERAQPSRMPRLRKAERAAK